MKKRQITIKDIAKALHISRQSLGPWLIIRISAKKPRI